MTTLTIDVSLTIWLLPLLAIAAYWCGPYSLMAGIFLILMTVFTLLNVFAAGATFIRRKHLATQPPPPKGGTLNVCFGVFLWSILISWLWTIGWTACACMAGVSLVCLITGVSCARGRIRSGARDRI